VGFKPDIRPTTLILS